MCLNKIPFCYTKFNTSNLKMPESAKIGLIVCFVLMAVMIVAALSAPRKYMVSLFGLATLFLIGAIISTAMFEPEASTNP